MVAASALSLSSACKASLVSEGTPVPAFFFSLKILSYGRVVWQSNLEKKIIDQILGYISLCFEIRAHLGHPFA